MANYYSELFKCKACQSRWGDIVLKEERDIPQVCPECGAPEGVRLIGGNITRASYIDGYRRFDGVREIRQINKALQRIKNDRIASGVFDEQTAIELHREKKKIQKLGAQKSIETSGKIPSAKEK